MGLLDQLNEDMKQAMKNREKTRLSVIRMMKSSIKNEEIHQGKELDDQQVLAVLSRELKQRRDSLREFDKAGRQDLVDGLMEEIKILENYMPEQLNRDEIVKLVKEAIEATGASDKKDMGKVMKHLMPQIQGKADGKQVNEIVQEHLQ